LREKMAALAAESGLSLEDIMGSTRGGKRGSVAPKYRNPEDPSQTWSGRGRMPIWLNEKLAKRGVKKEDFAI
jgi:DNA-binding protein H-NS